MEGRVGLYRRRGGLRSRGCVKDGRRETGDGRRETKSRNDDEKGDEAPGKRGKNGDGGVERAWSVHTEEVLVSETVFHFPGRRHRISWDREVYLPDPIPLLTGNRHVDRVGTLIEILELTTEVGRP